MPLSSLLPRGHVLENSTQNIITRFRNRERCINSVFWTMYDQLDQRKSTVLVIDKKEDLENLNYLISKHGLRELSLFIDDSQSINKTYLRSKANDEEKLRPRLGMRIANYEKTKSLFELEHATLKARINKLRIPLMGSLSIAEINDKLALSPIPKVDIEKAILKPPYTYNSYETKKKLYKKIETIYDPNYQFVSMNDPFNETIFLEADIQSVKSVIDEYLHRAYALLANFEAINKKVLSDFGSENLNRDELIKSKLAEVIAIMHPRQQLSDTEVSKLLFYQGELFNLLDINSDIPQSASDLDNGLERIENAVNNKMSSQYTATQADAQMFLEQLSGCHTDFPELENLIISVNKLSDTVIGSELFKENQIQKSVTFAFQKANLQKLIKKLAYALYFIEENTVYLEWKVLSKDFTSEDHTIINYLAQQNQFWDTAFENLFLQYYLNHTKPTLDSVDTSHKLSYLRQDYLKDFPAVLLKEYLEKSDTNHHQFTTWNDYLDQGNVSLIKRYPILVVGSDFYERHGAKLTAHADNFIFLNVLPKQTFKEEWISNYTLGYDPAFTEMTTRLEESGTISHAPEVSYNIVKNINGLSLSELNRAAKYIGQELHAYNRNYRIFQLKNVSIISMWSPSKNAKLLEVLSAEGIKEIIPNGMNHNLLPGIMADSGSTKFLLLEDRLLKVDKKIDLIKQTLLLQEVQTAGVKIVSLDNYKLINEGLGSMHYAIKTIQVETKVVREPVLA